MKRAWKTARLSLVLAGTGFWFACAAVAGEMSFSLPIRCIPGEDCWIANYVDVETGQDAVDFTCGFRTYDGHKGTDFAIRDLGVMRQGVDVLSAAPGTVRGMRDGMPDIDYRRASAAALKGRECGNGVLLSHGGGWTTQYCHLRKGSIAVKKGQKVDAGQVLGQVGLSGKTIFPHVHFQVKRDEEVIDPFVGARPPDVCGGATAPLWKDRLGYRPLVIYNAGISDRLPDYKAIRDGVPLEGNADADGNAVYLWADMFGVEKGDTITFELRDADNRLVLEKQMRLSKRRAQQFLYVGKRLATGSRAGRPYTGTVKITRKTPDGRVTDSVRVATGASNAR